MCLGGGGSQAHQQQEAVDRLLCTPLVQQSGTGARESQREGGGTRPCGRGFEEHTRVRERGGTN